MPDPRAAQSFDPRAYADPRNVPPTLPPQRQYAPAAQPQAAPPPQQQQQQPDYANPYGQPLSQAAADPRYAQAPLPSLQHDPRARYAPTPPQAPPLRGAQYEPAQPPPGRGFDLSAYMPNEQAAPMADPGQRRQSPGGNPSADQWSGDPRTANYQGDNRHAAAAPAPQPDDMGAEDALEVDEPKRRRRPLVLVAGIILAIGAGGGLAYGYKTMFAAPKTGQQVKVVKGPTEPSKVAPTDPGGRKVANPDSKLLDRLNGDGQGDDPGVKRVKPIQIGPNGTVLAPVESRPPPGGSVVTMPGIMLKDTSAPPPPPQTAQVQPAPAPPVAAPTPPRGLQITNGGAGQPPAAPLPQAQPAPQPRQKTAAIQPPPAPPAGAPPTAPKQPVKKAAPPAPAPSGVGAPPAKAAASGYVAVLQSLGSEGAALQALADLQQSYPAALDGRLLNVAKYVKPGGPTYYRVVVGPPASKQSADKVCTDVRAAGGKECFSRPDSEHEANR